MYTKQEVYLPRSRPPVEEAEILAKTSMHMKIAMDYITTECNTKGEVKNVNLNQNEIEGLKSLKKRTYPPIN